MKRVFLMGAGKSTSSLIKYFVENAEKENWNLQIADISVKHLEKIIKGNQRIQAINFDVNNQDERQNEISKADIVVSMLPPPMHPIIAKDCLKLKKHLVTASYVSDEMKALDDDAKKAGLIFLNEIGLDPGIDHMSAMKLVNEAKDNNYKVEGLESFTGGLLSPECEKNNPWKYKFTWNPKNVITAGQGSPVKFIQQGNYKYIPYHKLFRRTEFIDIEGLEFVGYANRDSLKYLELYGLENIKTFYRGTLRRPGFCRAWDIFVQLGLTDNSFIIEDSENMTYREFLNLFLAYSYHDSVEMKLQHYLHIDQDSDLMKNLEWLDLFKDIKIGLKKASPAQILLHILEQKWTLEDDDKDMIVMWHKLDYIKNGKLNQLQSSMFVYGEDKTYTAMAKTVGLPVAIGTKLILNGTIKNRGVHIPILKEIYEPVLNELKEYGITFKERYFDNNNLLDTAI